MRYLICLLTIIFFSLSCQAQSAPKYAAEVPQNILTPDQVNTMLLGNLEFFDGMPTEETVNKAYDFMTVSRAANLFLDGMPAASLYAMLEGLKQAGLEAGDIATFEKLMDARTLFLTANSSTPYIVGEIDLKNGPVVLEIAQPALGFVNDAYFLHVADIGLTGQDQGKGGKYLFLGPDDKDQNPKGFITVRSRSYRNWLLLRLVSQPEEAQAAMDLFRSTFNLYPLAEASTKPKQRFVDLSGQRFNTIHANDFDFFKELDAVVQYEPASAFTPDFLGNLAAVGIKKGQIFDPDAHTKKLLEEGVAIGNAMARAISFSPRNDSQYFYSDRKWYSSLTSGAHDFINEGAMVLTDRVAFHYLATGITPAMAAPAVGTGSVYAFAAHDAQNQYLDGGKTYKVTLPAPVPAKDFWSFMVYSTQHRSMLETDQKLAGLDNLSPDVKPNKDGSYTVYFGPKAPKGKENNWVQTIPGKAYCVLLRLYGPLEPWFDKSWKPGDFELLK